MNKIATVVFGALMITFSHAQTPDWPAIKSHIEPYVNNKSEYGTPIIQPHHNTGWEDGMFISRDGLHMYAFYIPADLLSFNYFLLLNPVCPPISAYIRGPLLGVDTITNQWGCSSILQSDIIYTSRQDTSSPFLSWQPSNLAHSGEWEGAPQAIYKPDGSIDIFVYTMSNSNSGDNELYWIRNTSNNPTWPGVLMPAPVNETTFFEDNPHIERIDDTTLVLMLDNHTSAGPLANIYYTISYDDGFTWQQKSLLSSVNTPYEDIQPHMWFDGSNWWLYFASTDTSDAYNRSSIFRMKQMEAGDFNSWGGRELVIGPGMVTDSSGFVLGVGEPTLTAWGDISFVVAVMAMGTTDTTDVFEIDPWYLPRLNPISSIISEAENSTNLIIYPNPSNLSAKIFLNKQMNEAKLYVYNTLGQLLQTYSMNNTNEFITIGNEFPPGVYFVVAVGDNIIIGQEKMILLK